MRAWSSAVAAVLAAGATAAPAPAEILWAAGAEPEPGSGSWKVQQEANRQRVRGDARRAVSGVASFRFELRDGERVDGEPEEIERAELAIALAPDGSKRNIAAGDEVAIGWSQWFAPDFPSDDALPEDEWCVFLQLKESRDTGSPLISMSCAEGRQSLALGKEHRFAKPYSERLVRGRWQRFVLRLRMSTGDDGLLELYRDGERVAQVKGQTIRPDTDVYLKAGLYRNAAVQGTAVAFADAFRIATTLEEAESDAEVTSARPPAFLDDVAAAAERISELF